MLKGILAVLIGAVSYGVLSTIAKLSYEKGYNSAEATLFQSVFGFIVLLLINFIQIERFQFRKLDKKDWIVLSLGGVSVGLTSLFYYSSVQYIPASIGIILLFQFIWIGFLFDFLFNKVKPSRTQLLALVVLLIGTFLGAGGTRSFANGLLNSQGLILGLLAALSYASYIFINGRIKAPISPISKSMLMMGINSLLVIILLFGRVDILSFVDSNFLYYGVPLALFGAVIPPILFAYGVPKIGVTYASILSSIELPVAVIFSITLLSETISFNQWLGVILILAAVLISTIYKK